MQEKSLIKKNILYYIEFKGVSKYEFYKYTGITRGILDQNNGMSEENTARFLAHYPEINPEWLILGEGEMLKSNKNVPLTTKRTNKQVGIPLIPIEAMAGYGNGEVSVMDYEIQEDYVITPEFANKGIKYLIRVSGSSMTPKYNNGDLLACRPITDKSFIQWGKVYVLDTDQGPIVKRLHPCTPEDEECLECRSDNSERYPPFKIKKTSIHRIAIVVGVLRIE